MTWWQRQLRPFKGVACMSALTTQVCGHCGLGFVRPYQTLCDVCFGGDSSDDMGSSRQDSKHQASGSRGHGDGGRTNDCGRGSEHRSPQQASSSKRPSDDRAGDDERSVKKTRLESPAEHQEGNGNAAKGVAEGGLHVPADEVHRVMSSMSSWLSALINDIDWLIKKGTLSGRAADALLEMLLKRVNKLPLDTHVVFVKLSMKLPGGKVLPRAYLERLSFVNLKGDTDHSDEKYEAWCHEEEEKRRRLIATHKKALREAAAAIERVKAEKDEEISRRKATMAEAQAALEALERQGRDY